MKFGISTLVGIEPLPLPELARRASELGLETLEINVGPTFRPIGDAAYPGHLDLARYGAG